MPPLRISAPQAERLPSGRCDSVACEAGFVASKSHRYVAAESNRWVWRAEARRVGTGSPPDRTPRLGRSAHREGCQPPSTPARWDRPGQVAIKVAIEGGWHRSRCFERPKLGGRSGTDPVPTLRISAPPAERFPSGRCDSVACEAGFIFQPVLRLSCAADLVLSGA